MPHRGRPSGARSRREWERTRRWEGERFEELDSDDGGDGEGMALVAGLGRKEYFSDDFKFTGADMGPRPRDGMDFAYESYEMFEDGEVSEGEEGYYAMPVAPRDKDELLAQRTWDRIRQAQLQGNPSVNLTHSELDAWERKRNRAGPTATRTRDRSQSSGYSSDRRRREGYRPAASPQAVTPERVRRRRPPQYDESSSPYASAPPGFAAPVVPGAGTFTPIGFYAPPAAQTPSPTPSRHSSRRASLSYTQQGPTPPPPQYQHQFQQSRYFSTPESVSPSPRTPSSAPRTPLPHESEWVPRSRSSSSVQQSQKVDPFQFQTYSPPVQPGGQPAVQYVQYSSLRRAPGTGSHPAMNAPAGSSSPTLQTPQPAESPTWREANGEDERDRRVESRGMPGQWGSDVSSRDSEPRRSSN
ncbi:MAG: hypothetical protein M1839_005555 [Geoglossum umbratile]|nr:MAG: hypothetical protein M1839_005555 [Geoglossum umbratile]